MEKKCSKCEKIKALDDFHRVGNRKNVYCKTCAIKISKEWYALYKDDPSVRARNRSAWRRSRDHFQQLVNGIKSKIGCCNCGERTAVCLDFHHFENKKHAISYLTATKSVAKLSEELAKCVCLCANCHRKLHAGVISIETSGILMSEEEMTDTLKQINPSFKSGKRKKRCRGRLGNASDS